MSRPRLRLRRLTAAAACAATIAACARNPVTGKSELALISESQEIEMGRQSAQEVAQTIGVVQDQALENYVQQVGAKLAHDTERPNLPWTFRVVDDPTPNAFALPGGFVFVTRGLMGLMENEAELATVLGHEIGHVTARHTVNQLSKQQLAQLGLGVGMILSPELRQFGQLASQGLQLLFLKYSRDDERQADQLGFRYALQGNYDVRQMPKVFEALQRESDLEHQSPLPNWLSTHPDPGERIQTAEQRIAALDRPLDHLIVDRAQYLQHIDELVYGDDPRNGFFQNGVFYQPDLRFQLALPSGWQAQNTPQAVVAVSQQQDAALQLTFAGASSPAAAAQQFFGQQGVQAANVVQQSVNGLPAVAGYFQAQTDQGVVRGLAGFVSYGGHTYQVVAYAPAERFGAYDALFQRVLASFAPVSDPRILNVRPDRMNIVRIPSAMSLAEFNQRYPSTVPLEQLAVLNQVPSASATFPAGTLVKQVVRGTEAGD